MNEHNKKLVPNIRFPEFKNTHEWVNKPFSDGVLIEHKDKSDGKCQVYSVSVNKGVVNQIEHLGRSFSASDTSKYSLVRPYDVIYTKSPTGNFPFGIVKQNLNKLNVIVSPLYGVFSPPNKYVGYIIDAYFESPIRTNSFLSSIVQKGAKNTIQITNSTFLSKGIPLPVEVDEQRKIADCLSSLDDLITSQNQKVEALKQHKKGLMQQLFPAEGETVPKLRFPEFENDGEWQEKPFNEVFSRVTSKNKENNLNVLTISAQMGLVSQLEYFNKSVSAKDVSGYYLLLKGDFAYNKSYSQGYPVGAIKLLKRYEKGVVSTLYICFRAKDKSDNLFFEQYFDAGLLNSQIEAIAQEGARNHGLLNLSVVEFFELTKLYLPSSDERNKIASFLTSTDELINSEIEILDALKEHKKGLMQQLFPSIDEGEV